MFSPIIWENADKHAYYLAAMFNFRPNKAARNRALGCWVLALAALDAVFVLSQAGRSKSPTLFVIIFGGLFVGIPIVLGIALITGRVQW